ncbi:hypothetical protein F2P56_003995, partial [Juglans regia]
MEKNEAMCATPTLDEIKKASWSISANSGLGLDGFSACFFMMAWDIVKENMLEMIEDFFAGHSLTTFFRATNLVLILKVDKPLGFGQFRLISLCSIVYKIMSKIMVFRLALILDKIISPEQASFIPGRSIFENISFAQELVQGGGTLISHLLNVDDILIFANGGKSSIWNLMGVLQ